MIEEVDRIDSNDIFTKMREINILLNNSKLIEREINFVYAVGDDLFDDKKERVKFFEYIIPVIPFINSSNADEQLRTLIKESGLEESIFTKEFISDVTTFIDDIDMRLLTNIFHEFVIYRKTLKPEFITKNDELFAMITYKNIDPKDFTMLNKKEGKLYELIKNKRSYIKKFINKIDAEIELKKSQIEDIENHSPRDITELRAVYINEVLSKLPARTALYNIKIDELLEDNGFENLLTENIFYTNYNHYNGTLYSESGNTKLKYIFSEIEKNVNPNYTYQQRVKLIESKHNNRVDLLKREIDKLKTKKSEIENWDLKKIFHEVDINEYLNGFSNNGLLRNFILNGYINENYNDYISLFHEVSITKDDLYFRRNVMSGNSTEFSFKLYKIENLVEKIDGKYFDRETILNFDLLDYLGNNYNTYSNKYDSIIRLLSNEKEKSIQFVDEYIKNEDRPIEIFIEKLVENWTDFWDFIYSQSKYSEDRVTKYLDLIIRFSKNETILKSQNKDSLRTEIGERSNFLSLIKNSSETDYYDKITQLLKELDVEFEKLDNPSEVTEELFEYVYKNNLYSINKDNLLQMFLLFGKESKKEDFIRSNYSTILKSDCEPLISYVGLNIAIYIENVYLKIEENKIEEEENLIKLLNHSIELSKNLKIKIIKKTETKISDLKKISDIEIKSQLLLNNKVIPKWYNLLDYYTSSEDTINENLIQFLEFENVNTELS
ncbi:hypothetical protein DNC80_15755, partial [Flavobacterium sp. SOK18b]|uniref:YobI family P-loop NTPase n=1 Tax=Flavobacterium sp. SOK18b TaxID=797900 RepID=UPI0015F90DC8